MKVLVQKYGGSSLASPDHIKRIADRVIQSKQAGYEVVVVVSALGDTTDHLQALADQITTKPSARELDMLLSVGERVSIALLAMAIQERNHPAISFTGSQVGIITSTDHTRARILEIKGDRIRRELSQGKIVVVAGYQGVSIAKEITTLGRGGSDTTAVALAAALGAERCEILSDVNGVYTANPRVVPEARVIPDVTYNEMLDLADLGAQVLKASAVEFAKRHKITIHVGSSFTNTIGTIVTDSHLDAGRLTGIAHDKEVMFLGLRGASANDLNGVIGEMADYGIAVKFLKHGQSDCLMVVKREDLPRARGLMEQHSKLSIEEDPNIGLVSIIGTGINFGTDIMAQALRTFSQIELQPEIMSCSETRLTFGIPKTRLESALIQLHKQFFSCENNGKTT